VKYLIISFASIISAIFLQLVIFMPGSIWNKTAQTVITYVSAGIGIASLIIVGLLSFVLYQKLRDIKIKRNVQQIQKEKEANEKER